MLTKKVLDGFRAVGLSIRNNGDRFCELVEAGLKELGGDKWHDAADIPALFKSLEKEVRAVLCLDEDGPRLAASTLRQYLNAARKCLLFGIPFRFGSHVKIDDLPKIKAIVEADKSGKTTEMKVKDAIRSLRDAQRRLANKDAAYKRLPLPTADSGDEWMLQLFTAIAEVLESPEAQTLAKNNADLRMLAKLCQRARKEVLAELQAMVELEKEVAAKVA